MPKDPHREWEVIKKDMTTPGLVKAFLENRQYALSKDQYSATPDDNFWAAAFAVRERIVERWIHTQQRYHKENAKRVYYLSMEFLIGRLLGNYIYNLGIEGPFQEAIERLGLDLEDLRERERDAGLGNGGLGRLAACFLDSMATLGLPAHGYGIRFDYGIFHQKIRDGYQVELPDEWLYRGTPWEFARPEYAVTVRFYGRVETRTLRDGRTVVEWLDTDDVQAVPYDFPIPGYKNDVVNTLRLWSARSTEQFDFDYFKNGDYEQAVHRKILSEVISKVLYPNDNISRGRELRLKQEYFLTAAAIADILRRFFTENQDIRRLPDKVAVQLNDTHPSLAVPELMRILVDDHDLEWEEAWDITRRVFAYTNHTLMPEALETWSVEMLGRLLPRHLQIIYEINARFLDEVARRWPGDVDRLRRMSLIEEGYPKRIRMAHLSIVGTHSVNGVSRLHTELLKTRMFRDFAEWDPGRFNNKTNGITLRRWLLKANPRLAGLIGEAIGDRWVTAGGELERLLPLSSDAAFRQRWRRVKSENKLALAAYIERTTGLRVDPEGIFDVQVKRMHEYKRQLLFGLQIIAHYLTLKRETDRTRPPRTFIIGGKAAPGYAMAKLIIKFLNSIADVVNGDRSVRDRMKVVFLENYRVSLAEKIFPASDLSEQISTAGFEASGTGNMKFMLNGALTIGTLDGANIEIAEAVGEENIFIFGLRTEEVVKKRAEGYRPMDVIEADPLLKEVIHLIRSNFFSAFQPGLFQPILENLCGPDPFFVCADFRSYLDAQERVEAVFGDPQAWTAKAIVNVAHAGRFSSDRTIREYAEEIWGMALPASGR